MTLGAMIHLQMGDGSLPLTKKCVLEGQYGLKIQAMSRAIQEVLAFHVKRV